MHIYADIDADTVVHGISLASGQYLPLKEMVATLAMNAGCDDEKAPKTTVWTRNPAGQLQALLVALFPHGPSIRLIHDKLLQIEIVVDGVRITFVDSTFLFPLKLDLGLDEWATQLANFHDEFGFRYKTLSGVAFAQLQQIEKIKGVTTSEYADLRFRKFYFAGRCEALISGTKKLDEEAVLVDINSAYPDAMQLNHPWGGHWSLSNKMPASRKDWGPCMIELQCTSAGAFPLRRYKENGESEVIFPHLNAVFCVTGWEYMAAVDLKLITEINLLQVWQPSATRNFKKFASTYYAKKSKWKGVDEEKYTWAKLILNSAGGKFGQNCREFKAACVTAMGEKPEGEGWKASHDDRSNGISFWVKPEPTESYKDVAVIASITGAVRAKMMRAIALSGGVMYCDTDSLVIPKSQMTHLKIGEKLGEWRVETSIKTVHIAAKKLYAFERTDGTFKTASKGVELTAEQIIAVANGGTETWEKKTDSVNWSGRRTKVKRTVKKTITPK